MKAVVFTEKEKVAIGDDLEPQEIEEPNDLLTRSVFTGVSTGNLQVGHILRGFP